MALGKVICITGIDTEIGKSVVTGLLAKYLLERGNKVITQKICQTGCQGMSEDILKHRAIMGIDMQTEDERGLTCPFVFTEPASPHLAARLEGKEIDLEVIRRATLELQERYDYVVLEGVGGLMVPLNDTTLLVDYLKDFEYDHILVSSPRLGSINHTLSALEVLQSRGIRLNGLVYNNYFTDNQEIAKDSRSIFVYYMPKYDHLDNILEVAAYNPELPYEYDFTPFISGQNG